MLKERTCPYCGYEHCTAESVDIGVGEMQCSPYGCERCQAFEISGADLLNPKSKITEEERRVGWYKGDCS